MTPDPIDHLLLQTDGGIFLVSIDATGVVIYTEPMPSTSLPQIRDTVRDGGIFVAAFAAMPNRLFAIEFRAGAQGRTMARQEAIAAVGEARLSLCGDLAGAIAELHFASWREDEQRRVDACAALTLSAVPGEA